MEWKTLRPQSEEDLESTSAGLKSAVEHHRPDATDQERCEGEHQCGGDTARRSVARAVIAKKPEGTWTAKGSRESSPGQRAHR